MSIENHTFRRTPRLEQLHPLFRLVLAGHNPLKTLEGRSENGAARSFKYLYDQTDPKPCRSRFTLTEHGFPVGMCSSKMDDRNVTMY